MSNKEKPDCVWCEDGFFKENPIVVEDERQYEDQVPDIDEIRWAARHNLRPEPGIHYDKQQCRVTFVDDEDSDDVDEIITHKEADELISLAKNDPKAVYEEWGVADDGVIRLIHFGNECSNDWAYDYEILRRS